MLYFIEMEVNIESAEAMKALGERLGLRLSGGECLELIGDVGAGKTTFTKGVAAGLAISEVVQSPTFTINRTYEARDGLRLIHYDFYRLDDPGIMADELAESVQDPLNVTVIEWGDIVASILPTDHVRIYISSPSETVRHVKILAHGRSAEELIKDLS